MLTNQVYDQLKHLTQISLPSFGTLYFALAQLWDLPDAEQVVGTIIAIDAFLGVFLGYSSRSYERSDAKYDGVLQIVETEDSKLFSLELNEEAESLEDLSRVLFKVNKT
jgi:hypothetical protein